MSDKMREDFEKWLSLKYGSHMVSKWDPGSGTYNQLACTIALESWKASREAVVIELPIMSDLQKKSTDPRDACYEQGIEDCREAIEAAGIKVKE